MEAAAQPARNKEGETMTDPRLNRTDIESILARLKGPERITAKMDRDRVLLARVWGGNTPYDPVDLVASLLDLVHRQDAELALIRAENDSLKAAKEAEPTDKEWEEAASHPRGYGSLGQRYYRVSAEAYRLAAERAKGKP